MISRINPLILREVAKSLNKNQSGSVLVEGMIWHYLNIVTSANVGLSLMKLVGIVSIVNPIY